jgi:L-histidine N-alpha-methyltransferase
MGRLASHAVEVQLSRECLREQLCRDVTVGLGSTPKSIPSTWFYDERGSQLFEEITQLDEYYQTRTERSLLALHAPELVANTEVRSLVELGSGSCEKTRVLLDELVRKDRLEAIVPIDISFEILERSVAQLSAEYPGAQVRGLLTDFEGALAALPAAPARLVAFLGGTIGNLRPEERAGFFHRLRGQLGPDDRFLLGCDLLKDRARLLAAYDDSLGITASFNRNVLSVMNRELDADFELEAFDHVALWNEEERWIEMRLRSSRDQTATLRSLDLQIEFREGEEILTEISAKFTEEGVIGELEATGFAVQQLWSDPVGDFALVLARPTHS